MPFNITDSVLLGEERMLFASKLFEFELMKCRVDLIRYNHVNYVVCLTQSVGRTISDFSLDLSTASCYNTGAGHAQNYPKHEADDAGERASD